MKLFFRKLMCMISSFCATFALLIESLHKDFKEDMGSWTHVHSTLT